MGDPIAILLVEDSADDAELVTRALVKGGFAPAIERVQTRDEYLVALQKRSWHAVVSDYSLPGFSGLMALQLMKERGVDLPFFVVSGTIGEELAVEVMRRGASDYLMKGNLARLAPSIRREIESATGRFRRRLAEAALQLRDFAVNQAPDPMLTLDGSLRILTANDTACRRFGYAKDELSRIAVADLDAQGSAATWTTVLAAARRHGRAVVERELRLRDGSAFPVEASISHFRYDEQDLWCCFLRDITERRRAEAALRSAKEQAEQASIAKSEFLANMSHELRTPLTAVIGGAELLMDEGMGSDQREQLNMIMSSGRALLSIINDLLDLSKIEAGKLELETIPVEVGALAEEVIAMIRPRADAKGLVLRLEREDGARLSRLGDPVRIRQILLNLTGNATKFTEHGSVTIRLADGKSPGFLRLEVADTGIGMDPVQQRRLFQPFMQADGSTTRKFGGTGLGLAIVKRLVVMMGGCVGCSSAVGAGSTFWVELPLAVDA